MNAEEFILIPKNMYMQQRPVVEQILNDPQISSAGKQLSLLQRYQKPMEIDPTENQRNVTLKSPKSMREKVIESLGYLNESQKKKSNLIYDAIISNTRLSLDNDAQIEIDGVPSGLRIGSFLSDVQHSTKNLNNAHRLILEELRLEDHLLANRNAKNIANEWLTIATPAKQRGSPYKR